ncbi:MAG TPA: hypothetical protein VK667_13360, partial [Ktedonobacteraceae bacterium]|nr:hypothetical protein [Ktedonobacteraceae bacterium]
MSLNHQIWATSIMCRSAREAYCADFCQNMGKIAIGLVTAGACAATFLLPQSSSLSILPVLLLAYTIMVPAIYVVFHRQALAFALPAQGSTTRVASLRP